MQRYQREISVAVAWLVVLAVLAAAAPAFYRGDQLRALLVNAAPLLVAALGTTLVIIAGQIDISIGSVFSVCGMVAGLAVESGWPMPLAVTAALVSGCALGAVNGALVAVLRLPSIVVTLASLVAVRETLRYFREGEFVRNLPAGFQWFGLSQVSGQWAVVTIASALTALAAYGLANFSGGRAIYATGSDVEAARLVGIRPKRVVFGVFVASGFLSGLASLLNAVRFADVDPNSGAGLELQAIAAVVVGGTSVTGGRGTVVGTVFGVLLLATVGPALVYLRVQPQWEKALQGLIILTAVASDRFFSRSR
jgi:rhamnose transport system permease protein